MAYTTIDDPSAYFQTTLWTGDGANSHVITNSGNSDLQADLIWIKQRDATRDHHFFDVIRGVTKYLESNTTVVEETGSTTLLAFGSDGFTVGSGGRVNANTKTYVAWNWKAGTAFSNDASSTSVGSIDSVGSVSTDAGFSIQTYSGNGSAGATVAHGLGVTPNVIIIKNRGSSVRGWIVYHDKSHGTPQENFTLLNTTAAVADLNRMQDTAPTSSVFSLSDDTHVNNASDTYVAYLFAEKQGYSKFGSYIGNGNANGTFVHTGFKPAFVMIKITDNGSQDWFILDSKRSPFNLVDDSLAPNQNDAEYTSEANLDFLSNGFKLRMTSIRVNGSENNYIYMAFAENPFVTSTGVPTTSF